MNHRAIIAAVFTGFLLCAGLKAQDQIFSDVLPSAGYFAAANELYLRGVSNGTSASPLSFGPTLPLARDQMTALIIRSVYSALTGDGENFTYTQTPWFTDVSNDPQSPYYSPFYKYIQKMRDLGISGRHTWKYTYRFQGVTLQ
jgi:hypothetical protein